MEYRHFSRLGSLLDRFGVTGRELANALHVDDTLVSKWRSNSRSFSPRSSHLKTIVNFFITLDSSTKYSTLNKLLSESYPDVEFDSVDTTSIFLKKWLLGDNPSPSNADLPANLINNLNADPGHFFIFKGNAGRREAIMKLLEVALLAPQEHELLLFSQENSDWFFENEPFLKIWREKNLEFLHKGGTIRIAHTVDRLYRTIASSLIRWLPLHMTGNTITYYYPQFLDTPIKITLYIVRDLLLNCSFTAEGLTKICHTYISFNPVAIQEAQFAVETILANSRPLFEKYLPHQADSLRTLTAKASQTEENSYFVGLPPFLSASSPELLRRILVENNCDAETIRTLLDYQIVLQKQLSVNSLIKHYRWFIDFSRLEQTLATDEKIWLNELSLLTGKRIWTSRPVFYQCIQELITTIDQTPHLELALIEGPPFPGLEGIDLWVKENTITVPSTIPADGQTPLALVTQELTTVNSYFYSFDQAWGEIPQIKHDREWIKQRLKDLIFINSVDKLTN
jgi:transcriptional regulator with XRE-family HTH domain